MCDVPALRFPEFTEEWNKYLFDDIAQYKKGPFGSALKKEIFVPESNDTIKIYEQQNAIKKDWKLGRYFISKDYFINHMQQFVVKAGDIIVSCAGTIGEMYELPQNAISGVFNQALMRVRVNTNLIDKNIFIEVFSSMINTFSKIYSNGSAIKNIPPFGDLKRTVVFIPMKNEQEKISKFISLIDERIATQNKIIEKLETLIKGIIETVISSQKPNTFIKNCLECDSSTLQESQVAENGAYPVYGATGINGYTETADVNGEAILITKDGSGVGTVKFADGEYSYIGTLNRLIAREGYCLKYLYFALQGFYFEPYKTGMAIPHIYFKDYGKAKIFCPTIEEQSIIAKSLSVIENKISVEKQILFCNQLQKSYLLSQMLI